jgi:RNA polymerase sigma factor (sigma-70 family)
MRNAVLEKEIAKMYPRILGFLIKRFHMPIERAEDIVQDTIINAIQYQNSFDGRNMFAWMCTIAKNLAIGEKRKYRYEILTNTPPVPRPPNQEDYLMLQDTVEKINELSQTAEKEYEVPISFVPGICAFCGKGFKASYKHSNQKYCSYNHQWRANYRITHKKMGHKKLVKANKTVELIMEIALGGEEYKDLAKKYKVAEGTIKSRVNRGREMLKESGL